MNLLTLLILSNSPFDLWTITSYIFPTTDTFSKKWYNETWQQKKTIHDSPWVVNSNILERQSIFASWDKDSYTKRFLALLPCTSYVKTQNNSSLPDLFTSSRSPSHIEPCHFKVSVLAPLQWGHQTLSSFGFPTYPHTSWMCSPLSVWLKYNNIAAFALDLKSTY
jgi:hypothetical protein